MGMLRLLPILLCLTVPVGAVLDGDPIQWIRHGYLVKVLGRDAENRVQTCTGSLISPSLVLTAASCVTDDEEMLSDFMIVSSIRGVKRSRVAMLVEKSDYWAVLRVEEIPEDKHSQFVVSIDEILKSKCYLIGFKTMESRRDFASEIIFSNFAADDFFKVKQALRLDLLPLDKPREGDSLYSSKVKDNSTACYEDAGAPMVCNTVDHGTIFVGLFQHLGHVLNTDEDGNTAKEPITEQTLDVCRSAYEMQFSFHNDDVKLQKLIEKEDLGAFVNVYSKCAFV